MENKGELGYHIDTTLYYQKSLLDNICGRNEYNFIGTMKRIKISFIL